MSSKTGAGNLRPAKAFYPARDLSLSFGTRPFSFFNDGYAAINRQNDSRLICWSSSSVQPKKGLNFWRRFFFFGQLEWWRPAGTLLGLYVAH